MTVRRGRDRRPGGRSGDAPILVFDTGDFSGGQDEVGAEMGRTMAEAMELMAYDALTFGEWDLNHGPAYLRSVLVSTGVPWVHTNYDVVGLEDLGDRTLVVERDGRRIGVIGLYNAIDDRRAAARAAGFLAIVGVALLPVIRYSVVWWNSLHQGQTIRLLGESTMDSSMIAPLVLMIVGTKLWFVGALLARARADNLRREAGKAWVAQLPEQRA